MEFTAEFVEFVRKTTRLCQFDFGKVAERVNASTEGREALSAPINADICRQIYAQDYSLIVQSKEGECSKAVDSSVASELTVQEILLQQELRQLENDKKIEQIFQRVLTTLETAESVVLEEDDEIVLARQRYKEKKETEQFKKRLAEEQQREQRLLEEQRLALSKRFDTDSEDAKGIDPFAVGDRVADSVSHELDTLEGHPVFSEEVMASFDMESLLDTPEFDMLLSQIEQDIGAKEALQSMGKDEGEEDGEMSELSEVLQFLAMSAEKKSHHPATTLPRPPLVQKQVDRPIEPPIIPEGGEVTEVKTQQPSNSHRDGGRDGGRGVGGRSVGRGRGRCSAGRGQQSVTVRGDGDSEERDYGSGSDEDDWAGLRKKMKQSGGSPESGMNISRPIDGFWGAYGYSAMGSMVNAHVLDTTRDQPQDESNLDDDDDEEEEEEEEEADDEDVDAVDYDVEVSGQAEQIDDDENGFASDRYVRNEFQMDLEVAVLTPLSPENESRNDVSPIFSPREKESHSPIVLPVSPAHKPSPVMADISPVDTTSPDGAGGMLAVRPGGILNDAGGCGRVRRAKGGNRLKGSVEVALKRREELNAVAVPADTPTTLENVSTHTDAPNLTEPVVDVPHAILENESAESGPPSTNILVPSADPFCPVLPPLMHAVLHNPAHLLSGKAVNECQNSVMLSFALSGGSSSGTVLQTDGSDAIIYMILAWVSVQLEEWDATIIGVHLSASQESALADTSTPLCEQTTLIIVLEGSMPHSATFLSKSVMQAMQSTTIGAAMLAFSLQQDPSENCFLAALSRNSPLSAIGSVVRSDQAAQFLHLVSQAPSDTASGKDWQQRLTRDAVVTCVLKPYLLQDGKALATVFSMCEKSGLRLCGLRTAYVQRSAQVLFGKLVHPDILSPPLGKCMSNTSDRDGAACVLVALFYSSRFVAAETLRNLLGPDDPSLAKRTDPSSIRAVCGTSKEANVCYPLSSLLLNNWRDTLSWYGPREESVTSYLHSIVIPPLRYAVVGISIEAVFSSESGLLDTSKMNRAAVMMATLQRMCIQCMQSATSNSMHFVTMWSCDREEQIRYGLPVCGEAEYMHGPSSYLTAVFVTHVGDLHVAATNAFLRKTLLQISSQANDLFRVNIGLKMKNRFQRREHVRPVGSNAQLTLSRSFADDDFNSHEDVGLQDVLVCSVSTDRNILDGTYALRPQELALHILQGLPSACHATILGICTPNWDATSTKAVVDSDSLSFCFASDKLHICLRGLHLLENISNAIRAGTDAANGIATSSGGVLMTAENVRMKSVLVPSVDDVRVLKGRRAMDTICREFLEDKVSNRDSRFMTQFATMSLDAYVPSWSNPQNKHKYSENRAGAEADMVVLRSLFCPGSFQAISVVVVPYPAKDRAGTQTGVFYRVFKKLEKEGFDIKHISTALMSSESADLCATDIIEDGEDSFYTDSAEVITLKERFALLVDMPVLAIVVQGNSALRRLRCVVGPIDGNDAMENYPTSIMANINTSATPESRRAAGLVAPSIFFSRTCSSTHKYINAFCQLGSMGTFELSLCPALSIVDPVDGPSIVKSCPASQGIDDKGAHNVDLEAVLRTLRDQCLEDQHRRDKVRIALSMESVGDVGASAQDVTCIVLTSTLINLVGLSPILHAVNKEGIKVVNVRTSVLHPTVARNLAELAGQSSLSMKPTFAALLGGPVLYLALEGASHSILRLKSILQQSTSGSVYAHSTMLNQLRGDSHAASALGKLPDGSWGLLASCSSRLAHNLLLYSFDQLYASTCSIMPAQECAQDAGSPLKEHQYYTPTQSPPHTPPKSAAAASPAFFTPPTSAKGSATNKRNEVAETGLMEEQVQWVFEETKSGRERPLIAEYQSTDLTELD